MNQPEIQHEGWDSTWDEVFRRKEWGKYPPEYVVRFVMRSWGAAPDRGKVSILDLGSGPGAVTWFLAREGFNVFAIDGSQIGIGRLKDRLAADGLRVTTHVGDYIDLPWPDSSLDGVIDNVSLSHNAFSHSRRCIEQVQRKLKPGGLFFSSAFTDQTLGFGLGEQVELGVFRDIPSGPLAGIGLVRFLSRSQIGQLYAGFAELNVESIEWSLSGMTQLVQLWLVTCRKAQ